VGILGQEREMTMRRHYRWYWCAPGLLAAISVLSGCGAGHGMTLGRVQGKVTSKGEPVRKGTVFFVPDASKGTVGPPAMAAIKDDGTYILSTDEAGDGALVGHHKIGVSGLDSTPISSSSENPSPDPDGSLLDAFKSKAFRRPAAPKKANAAEAAGDTYTDRGGQVFRYVIPKKLGVPAESGLEADVARGSNTINIEIAEDGTARIAR
jgi:hypothetical protein